MASPEKTVIFTDGASKGNPGPGGWGAIIAGPKTVVELGGGEPHTTNNRMELRGALEALAHINKTDESIIVYVDSKYVLEGATKWGKNWRTRGWITVQKKDVLNRDLWEPLLERADELAGRLEWVRIGGHVEIPGNERVDEIASGFALGEHTELYSGPRAGYGIDLSQIVGNADREDAKATSRARSRRAAYSYVSEVDGVVEVHRTWPQCEARTRGKRARFKKSLSAADEAAIRREFSAK